MFKYIKRALFAVSLMASLKNLACKAEKSSYLDTPGVHIVSSTGFSSDLPSSNLHDGVFGNTFT